MPDPLRIGIVGAGRMGAALGLLWSRAGHEVLFSSRHPEALGALLHQAGPLARSGLPEDAVAFGEIVLVAVPYGRLFEVGRSLAGAMAGKIVVECGNPRPGRDGPIAEEALARGTGVLSSEALPGVRLVRAFNCVSASQIESEAHRTGERLGVPMASDDGGALGIVSGLVVDAGFDPVPVGSLAEAGRFDRGSGVYLMGMTARELRAALDLHV